MNNLFSERYGYKEVSHVLNKEEVPESLRMGIWNTFYSKVFLFVTKKSHPIFGGFLDRYTIDSDDPFCGFVDRLWDKFFQKDLHLLNGLTFSGVIESVKELFFKLKWYEIYDFIEFFSQNFPIVKENDETYIISVLSHLNKVLEEERAAYKIVDRLVCPITSDEEIKEIEQALNLPDKFKNTTDHLQKALELLSNREKPDWENSIKESISALESMVQIIRGKKGTLGDLIKELEIHPALKAGFGNLYGWTSDEGGIRHAKFGEEKLVVGFVEAKYLLVTISAFINYLKVKL